jgi:RNA polymerase sigma-70 factor (ECF subfamily)
MDDQQQREVARGLRAGRSDAWRALYEAYAERVWRSVALVMGPGSADVADVVQETFLAAARSAGSYDPSRGCLWLWLWGIARRHVAMHYRRQARHDRLKAAGSWLAAGDGQVLRWLEGREQAPPDALATAELATLVRAALAELPPDYETMLTAKYLDGESVEQIAVRLQLTTTAVRSKLARARQAFREAFGHDTAFSSERPARGYHESAGR